MRVMQAQPEDARDSTVGSSRGVARWLVRAVAAALVLLVVIGGLARLAVHSISGKGSEISIAEVEREARATANHGTVTRTQCRQTGSVTWDCTVLFADGSRDDERATWYKAAKELGIAVVRRKVAPSASR